MFSPKEKSILEQHQRALSGLPASFPKGLGGGGLTGNDAVLVACKGWANRCGTQRLRDALNSQRPISTVRD